MAIRKGIEQDANKKQEAFKAGQRWAAGLPAAVRLSLKCDFEDVASGDIEAIDWAGDYKTIASPAASWVAGVRANVAA